MLGEPLGKRLCEDLVNFEKRLGFFIDQIFCVSKSDWNFLSRGNETSFIYRPTLQE